MNDDVIPINVVRVVEETSMGIIAFNYWNSIRVILPGLYKERITIYSLEP